MGLTFRDIKGSSLTIEEADGNFRFLTGSHEISGSLTISGSLLPKASGSELGSAEKPWDRLYVSSSSIIFVSGSEQVSLSLNDEGHVVVPGAPYQYDIPEASIKPISGSNIAHGEFSTIAGGCKNSITSSVRSSIPTGSSCSFIGGGRFNHITGSCMATIGGGTSNVISQRQDYSIIGFGASNQIHNSWRSYIGDNSQEPTPNHQYPLVISGTETVFSSGSTGLNSIYGALSNKITSSVGSTIMGFGNTLRNSYNSFIEGYFNKIQTTTFTGSAILQGCTNFPSTWTPGHRFNNRGNCIRGYSNCIVLSEQNNDSFEPGSTNAYNRVLDSIQSKIKGTAGGNVMIGNSFNSCISSLNTYPGSGSNADGSMILNSVQSKIRTLYPTNTQVFDVTNTYSNSTNATNKSNRINFGENVRMCGGIGNTVFNSRADVYRSVGSDVYGGTLNKICDSHSARIIGAEWTCIRGYTINNLNSGFLHCLNHPNGYTLDCIGGSDNAVFGGTMNLIEARNGWRNTMVGTYWSDLVGDRPSHDLMVGGMYNCTSGSKLSNIIGGYCNLNVSDRFSGGTWDQQSHQTIIGGSHNQNCSNKYGSIYNSFCSLISGSSCYSTILGGQHNSMSHDDAYIIGSCLTSSYDCTTHVNNIFISGGLRDSSADLGTSTQLLSSTGVGINWITLNTGSFYISSSVVSNTITFHQGDGTTESVTVAGGGSGSINTGSFMTTGSVSGNVLTFTQGNGNTFNLTVDTGSADSGNLHQPYTSGSTSDNIIPTTGSFQNTGNFTTIGGGNQNTASMDLSYIGGGCLNTIFNTGTNSFIGGGRENKLNGASCAFIGGGYDNCVQGAFAGTLVGGYDNCVSRSYSFIGGGRGNHAGGTTSVIIGGCNNQVSISGECSAIVSGKDNCLNHCFSFLGGGCLNLVSCNCAAIVGGVGNEVCSPCSFVGGGRGNQIHGGGGASTIGGGKCNSICHNSVTLTTNTIAGGNCVHITGSLNASIGGGGGNCIIGGNGHSIAGGNFNCITGSGAIFIGGGCRNTGSISSDSSILGGCNNFIKGSTRSSIGGGLENTIDTATDRVGNSILGGQRNVITGSGVRHSSILGGICNKLTHGYSFILGCEITSSAGETTFVNNFFSTGSTGTNNSVILANLPTSEPSAVGQVWISGSTPSGNSGYLVIKK